MTPEPPPSHKTFRLKNRADAPTFTIEGEIIDAAGNVAEHKEDFRCLPEAPDKVMLEYLNATQSGLTALTELRPFLLGVLEPADAERFRVLLDSPDFVVGLETLGSIGEFLLEAFMGRPTSPASPSGVGQEITGATSTDASPSPEAT